MEIKVLKSLLEKNEDMAEENQKIFAEAGVFVVNLMGSPGCGKTALIEKTVSLLQDKLQVGVIEGDIATTADAERLTRFDIPVVQINTEPFGGECHLDARMVRSALESLDLSELDLLFIENVGNLVCPAEFNLGENYKVMVASLTEGPEKALKYPLMFRVSDMILINKVDLAGVLGVELHEVIANINRINPTMRPIPLSARTGEGCNRWVDWLLRKQELPSE